MLFGSRARGDARMNSITISQYSFETTVGYGTKRTLADVTTEILYDTGAVLTPIPFPAGAYSERTALMNEIRREGIEL